MIARIEFSYQARDKIVAVAATPEGLASLREVWGGQAPDDSNKGYGYMWPNEILIDLDVDGPRLTALGLTFEVKSFKGCLPLTAVLPAGTLQPGAAVTVQVQIPHIGLLCMNEVTVEENCCTDRLQEKLDAGWRILCVCPPNAQRRPDYILGRTKEDR